MQMRYTRKSPIGLTLADRKGNHDSGGKTLHYHGLLSMPSQSLLKFFHGKNALYARFHTITAYVIV